MRSRVGRYLARLLLAAIALVAMTAAASVVISMDRPEPRISAGDFLTEGYAKSLVRRFSANKAASYDPVAQEISVLTYNPLFGGGPSHSHRISVDLAPGAYEVSFPGSVYALSAPVAVSSSPEETCAERSDMTVIVPDYTWIAYNRAFGGSFYTGPTTTSGIVRLVRPDRSSYLRGDGWHGHRAAYNPIGYLRAKFADRKMVVIAQSAFDKYDYCLANTRLIILYGHDEYWSQKMRDSMANAVGAGVNLLNMSGNTDWWLVEADGDTLRRIGHDQQKSEHSTSERLLGVNFRFAGYPLSSRRAKLEKDGGMGPLRAAGYAEPGGLEDALRVTRGLKVLDASHPLLAGTGLKAGQWFGIESKVVSVELDGWPLDEAGLPLAGIVPTPKVVAETFGYRFGVRRAAVMVDHTHGKGRVISLGSVGWVGALLQNDATVSRITDNAIRLLLAER